MIYLYSWNKDSETAKDLANRLGIPRIKHTNSKFRGSPKKVVINYGSSELPEEVAKCVIIQSPEAIATNSHKLRFFRHMSEGEGVPRMPNWTTDEKVVRDWLVNGRAVMARTRLTGHSGEGIVIMTIDNPDVYITAPLYTQYVKKKDEYRLHFIGNELIDFTRKALSNEVDKEKIDRQFFMVRNHRKGFIYVREGVNLPRDVIKQAELAMAKSGLAYGAVDVIYNERKEKAYVLEINTAPGMEGTTLENYANGLKRYIEGMK